MAEPNQFKNRFYISLAPPNYKKHLAYKGYVKSLSATNSEGKFDILPMHENFLTMLTGPIRIVDESGNTHEIDVDKALIDASNNIVKIFVEL